MTKAKTQERLEAMRLRQEKGLSVNKIAEVLGVSKSSVSNWVRDVPLTNQQRHQLRENKRKYGNIHQGSITNRDKHRKIREEFQQAGRKQARENDFLHLTGCMLYWAEGAKRRTDCKFTNSDSDMLTTFIEFLKKCLEVTVNNIEVRINVYLGNGLTLEEIKQYWCNTLNLPLSSIIQAKTNKPKSSQQKGRKLLYGTCELRVPQGTQYVQHILGAIQEYTGMDKPEWLD